MRMILLLGGAVAAVAVVAVLVLMASGAVWGDVARWAVAEQRAFQNEMALAVHGLRAGAPGAWFALLAAAGGYGFVHALGPGHGKFLIGGVGLGTAVPAVRLAAVALLSSLAQAVWAIILVYGGFFLLEVTAHQLTGLAERYLAPASYLAISAVGALLVVRAMQAFSRQFRASGHKGHGHAHHGACGCGGHGPSAHDLERVTSLRDTTTLILSIAVRPCTGALFLLVIAWQMDIALAGAAAVMVMGTGTAAMTGLVAVSSVFARGAARAASDSLGVIAVAAPSLQLVSGLAILWFAMALLRYGTP
ncbi:MAG: hypothetical protein AAF577_08565 [Pseudomonadota bacterium]